MSDSERPDLAAFLELEQLIHALGEEMAAWRRRAHDAESRLRAATGEASATPAKSGQSGLEHENEELHRRLDAAQQRTKQLLDRLRFLRQQHETGAER